LQAANAQRPIEVRADLAGLGPQIQQPFLCLAIMARSMRVKRLGRDLGPGLARSSRSVSGPSPASPVLARRRIPSVM
jgi:hypothetical protein